MSRSFDGSNDNVRNTAATGLDSTDFSMSVWFRSNNNSIIRVLGSVGVATSLSSVQLRVMTTNTVDVTVNFRGVGSSPGRWRGNNGLINTTDWFNFTAVYSKSLLLGDPILYLNGNTIALTQDSIPIGTPDVVTSIACGENPQGTGDYPGLLQYMCYWTRLLTPGEVLQNMNYPGSVTQDLKVFWPLFGITSPEIDYSGNANHGTVTGAVRSNTEAPITGLSVINSPNTIQAVF